MAVSGGGRSLQNMLEYTQGGGRAFAVSAVISSRPDAGGAKIAKAAALPVFVGDFSPANAVVTRRDLYIWLEAQQIDFVALAGFLKLFPLNDAWHKRVVNIHPALLPEFGGPGMYGDRVHAAVLDAKATTSGASVHFVNEHYDEGALIAQVDVSVKVDDTVKSLAARVFEAEKRLYPAVLERLASGDLPLPEGKVWRLPHDL